MTRISLIMLTALVIITLTKLSKHLILALNLIQKLPHILTLIIIGNIPNPHNKKQLTMMQIVINPIQLNKLSIPPTLTHSKLRIILLDYGFACHVQVQQL